MSAVQGVVDAGGGAAARLMERLEERMSELACSQGPLIGRHAEGMLSAGGKRLRPLLVFLTAGTPPPETDGVLRAAVAIELVHSATLVHDDVLDGSPLRRGRPTVVAVAGRRVATATGDMLFSRAFAELTESRSLPAVRALSRASSELAAGELMQRADAGRVVAVQRYLERCRLKTAVLFRAACELGALEGGAAPDRVSVLATFGERIGLAFQLLDDILDVSGPPKRTGKPRGADLLDGTVTLPLILARRRDPSLAELEVRGVRTPAAAARVCEQIASTGVLAEVKERALEMVVTAKQGLTSLPTRQHAALELVADGVVERYT